ncbi:MAG: hypothetical protein M3065_05510 [Actinomycetota bacterium]|nr:hypothetical protein [Actinomycetota bacterium]
MTPELLTSPATGMRDYDAKRLGRERLRARRRRVRTLRRRVTAVVLAAFMALWIGIYAQLATGHDPALLSNATRRAVATTTVSTPETSSATGTTATTAAAPATASTASAASTTAATDASSSSSANSGTASATPVTTKAS